jgi:heme/copper-type cytochrome/quinol oxidase subunit 2
MMRRVLEWVRDHPVTATLLRWVRGHRLTAMLLLVAGAIGALLLASRLPVGGKGCAQALQFVGSTTGDRDALGLLRRKCDGVDVHRMLVYDFGFLILYGAALALVCLVGAKALYRGRMRTLATWAGRGAVAAAVADAAENVALLVVPNAVRTGAQAGEPIALQVAQGFALIKWVAVLPAVLVFALVALTVVTRALGAARRGIRAALGQPTRPLPQVLTGPQPQAKDRAVWARNYWLPTSHLPDADGGEGICLSGGGIRSGAFALGALQVFTETGLLSRARFLATVSGGGYTGGAHQLLRARGGRTVTLPRDGREETLPRVGLREAFTAGSPEEAHLRRHGKYIADGAAQWIRAILTVLRNVLVNLALIYGLLFVLARPLGAAYASARPWSHQVFFLGATPVCKPSQPAARSFPCVWAWPDFPVGTWVAVGVPFALALAAWVANGWPARTHADRPGRLRRFYLAVAGGLAVLGIAVAVLVVGIPALVRTFQWLAARSGDTTPPEIAVIVALVTGATTVWNMLSGNKTSASTGPSSLWQKVLSGLGFATRTVVSFAVVVVLLVLVLVVLASHLAKAVRDYASRAEMWEAPPLDWRWWAAAVAILLFGIFFDQTRLSLHPFYKRRLATAFAVERVSADHAGEIDYAIPTILSDYGKPVAHDDRPAPDGRQAPNREGPTLILCAAANVSGQEVVPPGRRVTSFVFAHDIVGGPGVGYVPTTALEELLGDKPYRSDITLVAAMAISGAAFASAMGRMSGPFNILLSLTNARLGAWLPNPRYLARRQIAAPEQPAGAPEQPAAAAEQPAAAAEQPAAAAERPAAAGEPLEPEPWLENWRPLLPRVRRLTYLAKEVFGVYSPDDRLIYVTDGGHYENLGLVELLRRRCRTIYCVDASGDTSLAHTLSQAASLAYEELGVRITIEDAPLLSPLSAIDGKASNLDLRALEKRLATEPVVMGRIDYPPEAGPTVRSGLLVVGKAVLTADLPFPLRAHAARALQFPNEGTADQWFEVDQFNAYLTLGQRVAKRMQSEY